MDILPAIDLCLGKVVRLRQGNYGRKAVYSDDPASVADEFAEAGAEWIHVVDLDAARTGEPANFERVLDIRRSVDVKIELGGGIRNTETVEMMLAEGIDRLVIGSAAIKDFDWFEGLLSDPQTAERLALGLDAREGKLAVSGWLEQTSTTALEMARRVNGTNLGAIVYTDISRDGMLTGINIDGVSEMVAATDVDVIASGGVRNMDDVRQCLAAGCAGLIIGLAYYERRIGIEEAVEVASGKNG